MNDEKKKSSRAEYYKKHVQNINLVLNKESDADIISHLETLENMQAYIKELIREDIS